MFNIGIGISQVTRDRSLTMHENFASLNFASSLFLCSHILNTPVTERAFLEQLHELNHKINFVKQHSYNDTAACRDVQDVVEKLKFKVL